MRLELVHFGRLYQGVALGQVLAPCPLVVKIAFMLLCKSVRSAKYVFTAAFETCQAHLQTDLL